MRRALLAVGVVAAGCTGGGDDDDARDCSGPAPPVGGGFAAGGATPVPTAEIALRTTDGGIVVATNGSPAAVTFAPQGGFLLLASVRTTGFDACVDLTAAIRDPLDGDAIVSLEQRPAQLEDGGDGWLYPDRPIQLFNWANLFVCEGLTRDFEGGSWRVEITADDGTSVSTASRLVVPRCAYDDPYCIETCTVGTAFTPAW